MVIKNSNKFYDKHTNDLRAAHEHRGTWLYLLLDEVRKKGLDWDDFARKACYRCGCFHGEALFPRTDDLKRIAAEAYPVETELKVFDGEVVESSDDRLELHLHHCPLVASWLKFTNDEEEIAHLCDIAMEGDRGIYGTFPQFNFEVGERLGYRDDFCRLIITKKRETK